MRSDVKAEKPCGRLLSPGIAGTIALHARP